jgi:hypothetical protein
MAERKTRAELLQEAVLLEQAGGEWEAAHVAALWGVCVNTVYRSACPRVEKDGDRVIKGKPRIRFVPAQVRAFDKGRTKERAA